MSAGIRLAAAALVILAMCGTSAAAQSKPPLKLDLSSLSSSRARDLGQ